MGRPNDYQDPNWDSRLIVSLSHIPPYPTLFRTIGGSHLFGFSSPDSDYDVRGAYVLPLHEVVGLKSRKETVDWLGEVEGLKVDMVHHDIETFLRMLLKKNGNALEQLYSPWIVWTTPEHVELKRIAQGCITKHHYWHFRGFADNQDKLIQKESPIRVKSVLYLYRVLLAGIHLLTTGLLESNLQTLAEEYRLPYITDLIAYKVNSKESATISEDEWVFHAKRRFDLRTRLDDAFDNCSLPEGPTCLAELSDFLTMVRLGTLGERR